MQKLRDYLVGLGVTGRKAVAAECGTSEGHLRNIAYGSRSASPSLAVALEAASGRKVRRWDCRPDDWAQLWPDLVNRKGAPNVAA